VAGLSSLLPRHGPVIPIWLCPTALRQRRLPLFACETDRPGYPKALPSSHNRLVRLRNFCHRRRAHRSLTSGPSQQCIVRGTCGCLDFLRALGPGPWRCLRHHHRCPAEWVPHGVVPRVRTRDGGSLAKLGRPLLGCLGARTRETPGMMVEVPLNRVAHGLGLSGPDPGDVRRWRKSW
jgi:hypothetical protein